MRRPGHSGFTLLEIMVAVTIAGIVFTGLFAVFDKVLNVAEQVSRQTNLVQVGQRIALQISNDLDSFYYPANATNGSNATARFDFTGRSPDVEGAESNATVLEFATASSLSFEQGFPVRRINRVSYVLAKIPSNGPHSAERYRLLRKETPFADVPGDARKPRSMTMSNRIGSLELAFLGRGQEMPKTSWNADGFGEQSQEPPRAVRVVFEIASDSGDGERFRITRVLER
jgi:prepilin-type N-terminal cleavage/methylation domain-containing protein